jgi:hypothetical protein
MCQDCENRTDTLNAVFKARKFIMVKDPTAFKPKVIDSRHRVLHSVPEFLSAPALESLCWRLHLIGFKCWFLRCWC